MPLILPPKPTLRNLELKLEAKLNLLEERTDGRFKLLYWMVGFNLAIATTTLFLLLHH